MLLERFEEQGLSHYSYAIGCSEKGQIAIIDPRFDVEVYLEYAEKHDLVISHVFETHIHADYASGARHLAIRARATLVLSGYDKGEKYEIDFPHKECLEGDQFKLGSITLGVLHTPGHTPEHISFLVSEKGLNRALFTGDFLFVGSVGRPDLLGDKSSRLLAGKMYRSLKEKLLNLPDTLEIYPAHGAGSFCGEGLGNRPFSTLGQERLTNPYLKSHLTEQEFISLILSHKLPCPNYFFRMKVYNTSGDRQRVDSPKPLNLHDFKKRVDKGDVVVDLRDQKAFSKGHIPRSICIGAGEKVGFWASEVVPYDTPILLLTSNPIHIQDTMDSLARVGLSQIGGYLQGGIETWKCGDLPLHEIPEMTPLELKQAYESHQDLKIIDVRSLGEWEMGHIPEAEHIPCSELSTSFQNPPQGMLAFICAGGYRSILAASLAKRFGCPLVAHIPGGVHAWQGAGFPLS